MLKIEKTEVGGWEAAIRGMRNPMNSWGQSDSGHCHKDLARDCDCMSYQLEKWDDCAQCEVEQQTKAHDGFMIGPNDYGLMKRLCAAGTDHRKFMRMIEVYVDITAPLYWWKEYDTYKVGTVANSCSTMHKIADKEFTLDDFSHEHLSEPAISILKNTIEALNQARDLYLGYSGFKHRWGDWEKKHYWLQMIQLLPSSYNQKRTIMLSYEVLANIYKSRRHHKLDEWHTLCDWIEGLPYSDLITGGADCPNKKITVSEADVIAACTLSKLQNSEPIKDLTSTASPNA